MKVDHIFNKLDRCDAASFGLCIQHVDVRFNCPKRISNGATMREQKGIILVTVLTIILMLTIIAAGGFIVSTTESRMASIDRTIKRSFYTADAGIEEARGRLQSTSSNPINDPSPNNPGWKMFIGPQARVTDLGYNSSYTRIDRLTSLDYAVSVTHKLNSSNQVLFWGDSNLDGIPEVNTSGVGKPIYVITSNGKDLQGSKTIQLESIFIPNPTVVSALYSEGLARVEGSAVLVTGLDQCGGGSVAGITTTGSIVQTGNPVIQGTPPEAQNSNIILKVADMLSLYQSRANYQYNYSSGQTMAGASWGLPTLPNYSSPSSCSEKNVVYFKMNGNELRLTGYTSGCGILMVDGDLKVYDGFFNWNGLVLVKGSVNFTGAGANNITGALICGGNLSLNAVGGSTAIIYCGQAISRQTQSLPMAVMKWTELVGGS